MEKLACIKKVEQAKAEADRLAAAAGHYFHFSHCVPLFLYQYFFCFLFYFIIIYLFAGHYFPHSHSFPLFSTMKLTLNPKL
jgi:hypothetical protein